MHFPGPDLVEPLQVLKSWDVRFEYCREALDEYLSTVAVVLE